MKSARLPASHPLLKPRCVTLLLLALAPEPWALAQLITSTEQNTSAPVSEGKTIDGYVTHQSIDLGGHIAEQSGNQSVYDLMVNLHSGLRILDQSLEMQTVDPKRTPFFYRLTSYSFGYGGDPNNVTYLNASKGRLYDFRGSFRRNRQYFDYNLLANPLIPPTSTPFIPILNTPHLYNTVRQITDLNLTLAPLSPVSVRFGYNHSINQGPSYSTVHVGTEALLSQVWPNSTDNWTAGVDWKPIAQTTISYDQFITHYKGNTSWQLAGLNYTLSNGTPVSLGINISNEWSSPCAAPFNPDGTVNPTCNAFLAYNRFAPTRTLFPTEQFRFQSASIPHFTMNGRVIYSGTTSNLTNFYELFNGFESRTATRESVVTGSANVKRVNVNADMSAAWQITNSITATDTFDFWNFRMPGTNLFTETDYTGTSMLAPPGAPTTTTTPDFQYINQKTKLNTFLVEWILGSHVQVSIGYRYSSRIITDAGGDLIPIHQNWGLFGMALRPTPNLRVNLNIDAAYADNAFTRISPRQLQHYRLRSTWRPHPWLSIAGALNIFESRDNVQTVNHLDHVRDFSIGAFMAPNERWSLDLNYAYNNVYSSTIECYASTPPPPNAGIAPAVCIAAGTPWLSNGYYNAPINSGSFGAAVHPQKTVHLSGGYRMTSINGSTDFINVRQVNGSLQSRFQSPYAIVALDIAPEWSWHADYNYYGYEEGTPAGPTLPRSFTGNVVTLGVRYAF